MSSGPDDASEGASPRAADAPHGHGKRPRAVALLLLALGATPYVIDTLAWWSGNALGLVSFSMMMPLVAGAACFIEARTPPARAAPGGGRVGRVWLATACAIGLGLAGQALGQPILGALGLWLSIAAALGWLVEPAALGRYLLALSPLVLTARLTAGWPRHFEALLQRLSAITGEAVLELLGIATERVQSVILVTPSFYNVVDDTCSGVDTFTALVLFALMFGLLLRVPRRRLLALMALTLPLALLANGSRVAWVSVLGERGGAELAMGPMHDISGYTVFGVAYGVVLVAALALRRSAPASADHQRSSTNRRPGHQT